MKNIYKDYVASEKRTVILDVVASSVIARHSQDLSISAIYTLKCYL